MRYLSEITDNNRGYDAWVKEQASIATQLYQLDAVIKMMEDDQAHGHNMDLEFAHVYSDYANDQNKALEYAMKEYNARPDNIMVNGALAKIYSKMGDKAKAKTHLDKALRTGTKKPELIALKWFRKPDFGL